MNTNATARRSYFILHSPFGIRHLLACLALLPGCNLDHRRAGDPLLGNQPAAPVAALGAPQPAVPMAPPAPLVGGGAAPSTAALAAHPKTLDGGRELRLGTPANAGNPAAIKPIPLRPADAAALASGQRLTSYEQAQGVLASRGIKWQRSEAVGAEWKFSCSVPNRNNPYLSRTYEGRAPTELAAIQAVIDKIDVEAASRGN